MAINAKKSYTTTGIKTAIPLNRHGNPQFSISVEVQASATYTLQGSITQINREGTTQVWNDIPAMTGLTATAFQKITNSPLEALRLNVIAITGTVNFQLLQGT